MMKTCLVALSLALVAAIHALPREKRSTSTDAAKLANFLRRLVAKSDNEPACPAGQDWDDYLMMCVTDCPDGQYYDDVSGACIPEPACAAGEEFDDDLRMCIPDCAEGEYYDEVSGACVAEPACPAGEEFDDDLLMCVPDDKRRHVNQRGTSKRTTPSCPSPQVWDEWIGGCIQVFCPPPKVFDETEFGCILVCPSGEYYDWETDACVSGSARRALAWKQLREKTVAKKSAQAVRVAQNRRQMQASLKRVLANLK